MPKNKLISVVIIVVLVLLVPFLIGRITTAVLDATFSRPAPTAGRDLRSEANTPFDP